MYLAMSVAFESILFPISKLFKLEEQHGAAVFVNLLGMKVYRPWHRLAASVAAELKNFDKTSTDRAAICRQLSVLEHVTLQWRHEYHRGRVGQGHVINCDMRKPKHERH